MDRVIGHDGYEDISKIYLDGLPIADLEGGTADVKIIEDLLAGRILKLKVHLESSQSEEMTNKHIIYLDCARQLLDHVIKLSFHYIEMNPQSLIADLGECLSLSIPHVDKIHLEAFYDKLITDYNDQGLLRHVISLLHYLLRNKVINGNYSTGLLSKVFQLLKDFDITCCFHVSSLLLPYMATDWESCQLIWKFIVSVRSQEVTTESQPLDVTLSVICCLVHFFILPIVKGAPSGDIQCSSDPLFDVRTSCVFWDMIQCGLADNFNPLNRKRSLYLLNCVLKSVEKVENLQADDFVFCWNSNDHDDIWGEKELKECWEDVILLLETLEEKQVHIVSPVMARLKKLLDATRNLINGHSALHVSWMLVIFKRIFAHDSKSIIKKGLKEIFSMDLTNSPFLTKDNWTELIDSLLTVFNNSSIFARECHSNSALTCPPLVSDLTKFLGRFTSELKSINDKSAFITDLLVALSLKCLPDIPMVYMSYSLSVVATSIKEPLLKSSSLTAIRSLISKCLLTHKLSQRTATQHFLLSIIIALIDPSVGFLEIFQTLGSFKASEVLIFQSQSWNQTCQCVRDIAIYPHVVGKLFSFLQDSIKCLLNPQTQTSLSPESIARAILLSVDSHMTSDINVSEGCSNEEVLSVLMFPFLESLDGALTRPYIPLDRIITSVKLLHSLLDQLLSGYVVSSQTVKENKINHLMYTCLLPWLPNVLSYFTEALLSGFHISSMSSQFDCICLYVNTLGSLCHFLSLHHWVDCGSSLNGLAHKAVAVLVKYINNQTVVSLTCTLMGSISVLEWICVSGSTLMTQPEYVNLISQLSVLPVNLNIMRLPGGAADGGGSFVSSCLASYWNCFYHYLQVNTIVKSCDSHVTTFGSPDVESIAKICVDHFDILGDNLHTPVSCLTAILPQLILIKGVEYFILIVENLWPLVLELKDHFKPFIHAMTSFIQLVYHVIFLSSSDQTIIKQQVKFAGEISILGETKAGVFYILIDHLSSVFLDMINNKEEDQSAHLIKRMDIMMTACCFGPIFKKNLRVILDVDQFLKTLNESNDIYSFPVLHNNVPEDDLMVRVCAVTFLCKLSSTSCHASINFLSSFIEIIIDKLDQLYTRGFHYTVNSYIHRCLLRLIQTLLVVYQWIEESIAMKVIAAILNYLEHDNQLSVRYSMEWLVILLIQRYSSHWRDFILPQLDMNSGKRLSRYCSVFTVVCKLGQCFSMTDQCVPYYTAVFPLVFQWCFCHHFIVRLYATGTVMALWEQCQRLGLSVTGESPVFMCFSQFIPFIEKYSDISKSKKLSSNAFFSLFHPLDDYNLQNIFHILPALTSVMEDEWILLSSFQSHSRGFWSSSAPVPLDCTNQRILDSFQDVLRQKFTTNNDEASFTGQILQYESHQDGSDNVQKKAIPWNSPSAAVLQELFPFPFLSSINKDCQHAVNPNRNGMILIASLIHKQANLGGLCRTCEIFGVSEVVLGGISVLEEREFKSLSVTAEKWLKITQVKPGQLKEYLMELKKLNYNLIGLEQTAHSTNVTNYKFKSRTALLLGNEREGIPVDLIHLLDECVVIPQYGVIRSLNVHVSGAIAMWEYIKQYLDH